LQCGGIVQKKQNELDEKKLIQLAQAGDEKAFAYLVKAYQSRVMKIISRYVDDYSETQDLVQETFIKVFSGLERFRGESQFYTWLYRIAINTAKNHLIKKSHTVPTLDVNVDEEASNHFKTFFKEFSNPENELQSQELQQQFYQLLEEMPEELRITLLLRDLEGLSYEDIADIFDCPIGTIRSRIFRAREFLFQALGLM
jgi:RNA polymerase sigma-70 factor, ECF subfamily